MIWYWLPQGKGRDRCCIGSGGKGELPEEEIDAKCRKILTYKYILGLKDKPFVRLSGLGSRINTPQTRDLIRRLNLAAITVLNNKGGVLPLHPDLKEVAILNVGDGGKTEPFDREIKKYIPFTRFQLRKDLPEVEQQKLRDSLAAYRRVIVTVTEQRLAPYQSFLPGLLRKLLQFMYSIFRLNPCCRSSGLYRLLRLWYWLMLLMMMFRNVWLIYF